MARVMEKSHTPVLAVVKMFGEKKSLASVKSHWLMIGSHELWLFPFSFSFFSVIHGHFTMLYWPGVVINMMRLPL